jgi:hypothetical protein
MKNSFNIFSIMSPKKDTKPSLLLVEAIKRDFGCLNELVENSNNLNIGQFDFG